VPFGVVSGVGQKMSVLEFRGGGDRRSIVTSMSHDVCLSPHITRKPHGRTSPNFMHDAACGRGSIGPPLVALRHNVFPVLWIVS